MSTTRLRLLWVRLLLARRHRLHRKVRRLLRQSDVCGVLIDGHLERMP